MKILANGQDLSLLDGVERDASGAPIAFRIWPAGEHKTDKGDWIFSRASAAALMAQQAERGNLFSIDVDHMSLNQDSPVESRKAVGWHRLELRDDENGEPELWACDVQWTDTVRSGLQKSPPEWRYFSPAYDVDRATREVTRYINTALTNNPATHNVTALAASAAVSDNGAIMAKVDIDATLAALRAGADSDDEKVAKRCRTALAAFHAADDAVEDEKKEASEASDDDKDDEKKEASEASDDDKKDEEKASVAATVDLARRLHESETKLAAFIEETEREKLLASRPDFSAEVRATLATAPLATVKAAVATWKRVAASPVEAARAATTVTATVGATQVDGGDRLPAKEADDLDVQMGLKTVCAGVVLDGNRLILNTMTPAQAAAARKGAAK